MSSASNLFNAEEILDGICGWVRIESPTYEPDRVNRMMDEAEGAMRALGAAIERIPGTDGYADVVKATLPFGDDPDAPGILVLGHLDTVHPGGTIDGPLTLRREGDKVYGPGIYDMKGGMYLAYYALRQLLKAGQKPALPVTFLFISDEEVGSPSTRALIEAEAKRSRCVLVPEPSRQGNVVTGRHAFLRYRLNMHGKPAHAGADNRAGRSAIRAMARLIDRLEGLSDFERGITYSVGVVRGGQWVNVIPIECTAEVLCVAPTEAAFAEVQATMAALKPDDPEVRLVVEPGPVRPLFRANAGTMALYEMARQLSEAEGIELTHGQFGGGSDGNFSGALGVPTLDGLGVRGGGPHTHGEHLLVSSLEPRARLLAGLFESIR
ncbi:MAG: M20/M25/M40 family metallo-hydrolase [Oceanibaculum nanhaiense]|jgi:glutamate carboxypeptidase|uniref:M20/M25/M40 family metallo-hydrolase n=1 Tax=Oceanibaculum nanhaiense TaxID=1909734 RepID=UPI0032EF068A